MSERTADLQWLLTENVAREHEAQPYGDLTGLNTARTILDAVGSSTLRDIVDDYLDLLGTSAAVYEINGDYAQGIFASGWCRRLDSRSRELAGACSNAEALAGGQWHCHESCWTTSSASIATGEAADLECAGGIRIHAVPIFAGDEVIGSINFGYGSPPESRAKQNEIAAKYGLDAGELAREAESYPERPAYIIELAKKRLRAAARLIGEIVLRRKAESALRTLNETLESAVAERTAKLEQTVRDLTAANEELEAFAYTIAHDLRAPLRAMEGFSGVLRERHAAGLDEQAVHYLARIQSGARRMARLIDDLLDLSRFSQVAIRREAVDLSALASEIIAELRRSKPADVTVTIAPGLRAFADPSLCRHLLSHLLRNGWKFASQRRPGHIEVGSSAPGIWYIRDDGAGFDMDYAGNLFGIFNRLAPGDDPEGTGIGLATVQRIAHRHGGRVWADAAPDRGATFFFTLSESRQEAP